MSIIGTKGDNNHRLVLQKILDEGTLDVNPRPHYSDGTPAHTYSINHIMQQYDLSKRGLSGRNIKTDCMEKCSKGNSVDISDAEQQT